MTPQAILSHILFALAVTGFATIATALLIRHLRIIDIPNERSSHTAPTPRGGGLAIVGGFLFGLLLIEFFAYADPMRSPHFLGLMAAQFLIAAISFHDDIQARHVSIKFAAQLLGIGIVMATGIVAESPFPMTPGANWLFYPLTLLWILGLTNAYNFMDGLDGMAAGTAVIVSAFFSVITYQQGSPFIYLVSLVICAASFGFLIFNWPPAKIFMGDIGSTFLGFSFAALAIVAARHDPSHTSLFVMPLLLLHFLFDTVFTFSRRFLAKENVLQAHRSHLYQLLNRSGASHRQVSLLYAGMAVAQGLAAIWLAGAGSENRLWIFLPFLLTYAAGAFLIVRTAKQQNLLR